MNDTLSAVISGRKTFFITPDPVLFPENYLEEYMAAGYECYFIGNDIACSLSRKIDILVSIFKDSIIFFNIDANIPDLSWPLFIRQVQKKYGDQILCGVMYEKRQSEEDRRNLEHLYLFDIQVKCGCFELEYQKKSNFGKIEKVLIANNAQGRRKSIRVICSAKTTASILFDNVRYNALIKDISLNHFSCVFADDMFPANEYQKIPDIQLNLRGLFIRSAAILVMIRKSEGHTLFVFMFVREDGTNGLDTFVKQLLTPKLYEMLSTTCKGLLNSLFYYKPRVSQNESNEELLAKEYVVNKTTKKDTNSNSFENLEELPSL